MAKVEKIGQSNEEIKQQLRVVKTDVENLLKAVEENTVHNAVERAKQIGEDMRQWGEKNYERANEVRHQVEDKLRVHPITATLAAFGIGILAAKLFGRKHK